jgi:hypothetical protein
MRTFKSVCYASLLAAALVAAPTVSASVFNLTSDHCTGGCLTGQTSAGTVTVTDLGGGVLDFSVTLVNGNQFVNTGFPLTFGFNLNGDPSIAYTNLTAGWGVPGGSPQSAGTFHQDGTGDFEYGVLWGLQGGGNATPGPLHFDIFAAGLTLADLQTNAFGQFFAVDIISGTTGLTGNVDASTCTTNCGDIHVPEPGPLALIAIGMLALVGTRMRRSVR